MFNFDDAKIRPKFSKTFQSSSVTTLMNETVSMKIQPWIVLTQREELTPALLLLTYLIRWEYYLISLASILNYWEQT